LRVEVEEEAGIDQEVGDCPMGLAFFLSFTVESHPELWNIQKRGGAGEGQGDRRRKEERKRSTYNNQG
jgi:hypothetical protein